MTWLALLWRYRSYIGVVLAAVAVSAFVWAYGREAHKAGAAEVQAKWDADTAAREIEIARAAQENEARARETKVRNEEVINEYQKQVSRINADRDSVARRLHDAEVRLRAMPRAADQSGTPGGAEQPEGSRSIDAALDAYDRACRSDAAQLEALIRELRGQLDARKNPG